MSRHRLTALRAYVLSALFGMLGGLVTITVIGVLNLLINLVWERLVGINPDEPSRTILIPVLMVVAALILIALNRTIKKPLKGLDEIMNDLLHGEQMNWRVLPKGILISLTSIVSGASLGPEAPSAYVSAGITAAAAELTDQDAATAKIMGISSLSGMLGGLLDAPFLPVAMIVESAKQKLHDVAQLLTYSMVSAVFGAATVFLLLHKVFTVDLGVPPYTGLSFGSLLQAFLFGLAGAFGLILVGIVVNKGYKPLRKRIGLNWWQHTLAAAIFVGLLMYWLPVTMFSGQNTLPHLVAQASTLSALSLLVIGVVKMLSTTILLDSGFFGGPIFPAIFAGTAFGLAFAELVNVPTSLAVPAAIAGLLTVAMRRPFSAALLTIAIVGLNTSMIVVMATAGAMIIVALLAKKEKAA